MASFPLGFALRRLTSFGQYAWNEIQLILGVEKELRKLQRTMLMIQDLLEGVEWSHARLMGGTKGWNIWFEDMTKLAYEADSILDDISYLLSTCDSEGSAEKGDVRSKILSALRLKLPRKIYKLRNRLEELARDVKILLTVEKMKTCSSNIFMWPRINDFLPGSSQIDASKVVGRENYRQDCVLDLTSHQPEMGPYSVLSMVGMAGIGKTTLARLVYDSFSGDEIFEKRMWVGVSLDFDIVRITKSMVEALTGSSCLLSDLNCMQDMVKDLTQKFRFLLVLDDYWSEALDDWELLSLPFRSCAVGSKIIVTTRSFKVSSIMRSFKTYSLNLLSDDDCWKLMKQRIFPLVGEQENLQSIGREIAKNCKGLPLAAKAMASLLSNFEHKEDEWLSLLGCNIWDLPQDEYNLIPSLMLSYIRLTPQLKKCFAYCSLFRKDHEFDVEELVLLWMAEGFIEPIEGIELESLGRKCFNDLYSWSFFEKITKSAGEVAYKMHDLVHDLARMVSVGICSQVVINTTDSYRVFGDTCHLSIVRDNNIYLKPLNRSKRLRTLIMIGEKMGSGDDGFLAALDDEFFVKLCSLRVLDMSGIGLILLPWSFEHLKFLRHLNLSGNPIRMLPDEICDLLALQTLKLEDCPQISYLPEETRKLTKLRHLELDIEGQIKKMPPNFGKLTDIRSLSAFVIGNEAENGIGQIRDMNSLRGSFCITNIHRVRDVGDAIQAKLDKKSLLEKLRLEWVELRSSSQQALQQSQNQQGLVLANLRPHENLKKVAMKNYCGRFYPPWLCEPNRKLTTIYLERLMYCDALPPLGQLDSLKFFRVSHLPLLESIDEKLYGDSNTVKFPSLESFEIEDMARLRTWEYETTMDVFPRLVRFKIDDCPELTNIPENLTVHPNSEIQGCPNLYR